MHNNSDNIISNIETNNDNISEQEQKKMINKDLNSSNELTILQTNDKSINDDTKNITNNLFNNNYDIANHNYIINDTDRTIIGLLWHENVIDYISKEDNQKVISFYCSITRADKTQS